jgi:hypothetical protein
VALQREPHDTGVDVADCHQHHAPRSLGDGRARADGADLRRPSFLLLFNTNIVLTD